jgi:hypothetical protein
MSLVTSSALISALEANAEREADDGMCIR